MCVQFILLLYSITALAPYMCNFRSAVLSWPLIKSPWPNVSDQGATGFSTRCSHLRKMSWFRTRGPRARDLITSDQCYYVRTGRESGTSWDLCYQAGRVEELMRVWFDRVAGGRAAFTAFFFTYHNVFLGDFVDWTRVWKVFLRPTIVQRFQRLLTSASVIRSR